MRFDARFDKDIAPGGYAWWYIDAIADDGAHALTCIAFIGSVFSPYYAWANRKSPADPEDFCAINVALYGRKKAWSMTERGKRFLRRRENFLQIGRSSLRWENNILSAEIDEVTVPIPSRLRGTFTFTPGPIQNQVFTLNEAGAHRWQPIAPTARITVAFKNPSLCWSGPAYLDRNEGARPLAADFSSWQWSRAIHNGEATIFYDTISKDTISKDTISKDTVGQDGAASSLALKIGQNGAARRIEAPPFHHLPKGFWGVSRAARSETPVTLTATLEDAPFYLRSRLATTQGGNQLETMHESLDLKRLSAPLVPLMLPFRMPRTR